MVMLVLSLSVFAYVLVVMMLSSIWFASSSLKLVVSFAFSSLINFVLISSWSSLMSLLSAFDFSF